MRQVTLLIFTAGIWVLVFMGVTTHADTLTVTIANVYKGGGSLMVQVLASEDEFKGEAEPVAAIIQRATEGEMSYSATLPAGTYALRVMHDVNGNGELNSYFVGMPTEPWAFSNNATGKFGPPTWADVQFEISGPTTQTIQLNK